MDDLDILIHNINEGAGFEVYGWGATSEINDFEPTVYSNYVRAVHNLRDPKPGNTSLLSRTIEGHLDARLPVPFDRVGRDIVTFGKLPREVTSYKKIKIQRTERRGGLLGLLGMEKIVEYQSMEVQQNYDQKQPVLLSEIVNTDYQQQAYYVQLTISADKTDTTGRRACNPTLTIVGTNALCVDIVTYLYRNPERYNEFLSAVLPSGTFPHVHRELVAQTHTTREIVFLSPVSIDRSRPYKDTSGNANTYNVLLPSAYENAKVVQVGK